MSYFIIQHELLPMKFLSTAWDYPGRRWRSFEDAIRFGTKNAATLVVDTMFPGAIVVEVSAHEGADLLVPDYKLDSMLGWRHAPMGGREILTHDGWVPERVAA